MGISNGFVLFKKVTNIMIFLRIKKIMSKQRSQRQQNAETIGP
jgi:high-affinity nickel permease